MNHTTKENPMNEPITPDEIRTLTLDEAKALPGMLGRIASAVLAHKGEYGYTDTSSGRKILLRLAR